MTDNHMRHGSTLTYADVVDWTRKHDLIANRVALINQMHGCQYDYSGGNPCVMRYHGGWYEVVYCGTQVACWNLYDVPSVNYAFERIDVLNDILWNGRRDGCLSLSPT